MRLTVPVWPESGFRARAARRRRLAKAVLRSTCMNAASTSN